MGVDQDGALCPECWRDCEFITGCACHICGVPLPGEDEGEADLRCDDCLSAARPWEQGRAAITYRGVGRSLVLALKHGDRPDLAAPLGQWLARVVTPLIRPGLIVAPVPLHPRRLLLRKYNQAGLLSAQLARRHSVQNCPGLLVRSRPTVAQDHRTAEERFENLRGALAVSARYRDQIAGRPILVVDDVMASGATMSAAAEALRDAASGPVLAAVLARAVKE